MAAGAAAAAAVLPRCGRVELAAAAARCAPPEPHRCTCLRDRSGFSAGLRSTNWRRTSMPMMPRRARARATPKPGEVQAAVLRRLPWRGAWPARPWAWRRCCSLAQECAPASGTATQRRATRNTDTAHEQRAGHQQQLKVRTRADEQQHRHAYAVCAAWFMSDRLSVQTQKQKRKERATATGHCHCRPQPLAREPPSSPLPPVALPVVCGLWSIAKHLFPIFCESAMRGVYFLVRHRAEGVC